MPRLEGKYAVIVGAGSGADRAAYFLFAKEGAAVLTRETGGDATFIETDLADPTAIERDAGGEANPKCSGAADEHQCPCFLREPEYDVAPWAIKADGQRARLGGWVPSTGGLNVDLHNLFHVWVGGDMGSGTFPNNPAFFLHHCNVDRIWEAWPVDRERNYSLGPGEGPALHRLNSTMFTLIGTGRTPSDVLNPAK